MVPTFSSQRFSHVEIPGIALDPINRKLPRHRWDREDREVLCLLYRLYENPIKDKSAIFNYLYKSSLDREGFQDGLAPTTIATQWHDMRIGSNGNDLWRKITIDQSLAECRLRYRDLRSSIEDAASVLGLDLCMRVQPLGVIAHSHKLGKRAQGIEKIRGVLGEVMSAAEDTEPEEIWPSEQYHTRSAGETPGLFLESQSNIQITASLSAPVGGGTPVARRYGSSAIRPHGKAVQPLRVNTGLRSEHKMAIPRLLFRFSDDLSAAKGPFLKDSMGFIAGSFTNNPQNIPSLPTEILQAVALLHLTPAQRICNTPFISFFSGMLPTIHRALRSSSQSYVTVIDSYIAEKALKEELGGDQQSVYSVYELVAKFGLQLRNGYTGPTEYLVFGVVPSQAIVAIFKISDLITSSKYGNDFFSVLQLDLIKRNQHAAYLSSKLAKLAQPMLYGTGQVVGRLLALGDTKPEYVELLARKIASWWRFAGYEGIPTSGTYRDYLAGVCATCGSCRSHSVGLEEEEDMGEDDLQTNDDLADRAAYTHPSEVNECPGVMVEVKVVPHLADSSYDDSDLIDRQLEWDCPELSANHRQISEDKSITDFRAETDDIWVNDAGGDLLCPVQPLSLEAFAEELFHIAEGCSPTPSTVYAGKMEGSP